MFKQTLILRNLALLLLTVVLISGCSSKPSIDKFEQDLRKGVEKLFPGGLKVISFEILDEKEVNSERYKIKYKYQAEFLKESDGRLIPMPNPDIKLHICKAEGFKWIKTQIPVGRRVANSCSKKTDIKVGDIYEIKRWRTFRKSKNGWK